MFAMAFTGEGLTDIALVRSKPVVTEHAAEDLTRAVFDAEAAAQDAARAKRLKAQRIARARARQRWLRKHYVWPVRGPITSRFGWRVSPITGGREFHGGTDLACHRGGYLRAPKAGRVTLARYLYVYGRAVTIRHAKGWKSFLSHMSRLRVRKGMRVRQGQIIGRCGSSGWATGPHVHYELRAPDGRRRDAIRFTWPPKAWRLRAMKAHIARTKRVDARKVRERRAEKRAAARRAERRARAGRR